MHTCDCDWYWANLRVFGAGIHKPQCKVRSYILETQSPDILSPMGSAGSQVVSLLEGQLNYCLC